jgi:hypothetical protein
MLVIRRKQMNILSRNMRNAFEERMVLHLKEFFPDQCKMLGEKDTRAAIRYGMARAETYGLGAESDLAKYLNVMFTFGRDFDTDPELPWASAILNASDGSAPSKRLECLYQAAIDKESEGRGFVARDGEDSFSDEVS